jgi:hypothetical protein
VEGRKAVAALYRPYGTMIVLDRFQRAAFVHHVSAWTGSEPSCARSITAGTLMTGALLHWTKRGGRVLGGA